MKDTNLVNLVSSITNTIHKQQGVTHIPVEHQKYSYRIPVRVTLLTPSGSEVKTTSEHFGFYKSLGLAVRSAK